MGNPTEFTIYFPACSVVDSGRGVLLIWIIVEQGHIALAEGADVGCLDLFLSSALFFLLLWEMAQYRLIYCLKGPLHPKQPTYQPTVIRLIMQLFGYRLV